MTTSPRPRPPARGAQRTASGGDPVRRQRLVPEVARPRSGSAVVWVSSPLQLLSAIEAHSAGLLGKTTVVHPREDYAAQDAELAALVRAAPEGITIAPPTPLVPSLRGSGSTRWATGDPFSRRVQLSLWGPIGVQEVVILDDGVNMLHFLKLLTSDRPLPLFPERATGSRVRRMLALATRRHLRRLASHGRLLVISALPVPEDLAQKFRGLGGHLESHHFEWLGTRTQVEVVHDPTIVIGSALAADGLVREDPYVEWLFSLTADGPLTYFAHSRETPEFLARLAEHPMVHVRPYSGQVETRLRGLRPGQTVRSLPSSALPSLRLLLETRGGAILSLPVPDGWWTEKATAEIRERLPR